MIQDCAHDAKFRVILLLAPMKKDPKLKISEQYIPVQTRLEVCFKHRHSNRINFQSLISHKGWLQICENMKGMKFQAPDRKTSKVGWRVIGTVSDIEVDENENLH